MNRPLPPLDPIDHMLDRLTWRAAFGDPVQRDDTTVVPITDVTLGFGYGYGFDGGIAAEGEADTRQTRRLAPNQRRRIQWQRRRAAARRAPRKPRWRRIQALRGRKPPVPDPVPPHRLERLLDHPHHRRLRAPPPRRRVTAVPATRARRPP
ncbi:MAG: hypothetical protein KIS91_05605 [Anaerolineae bacterium]|nr:hypothetical protein [Anaerolineae bacterium]